MMITGIIFAALVAGGVLAWGILVEIPRQDAQSKRLDAKEARLADWRAAMDAWDELPEDEQLRTSYKAFKARFMAERAQARRRRP
jgi:hypothetical protein